MSVQSMVSLGKVGRILAGSIDASELNKDQQQQGQSQAQHHPLQPATSSGTVSSSSSSTTATSMHKDPGSSSTLHHQSSLSQSPPPRSVDTSDKVSTHSESRSGTRVLFHEPDVIASTKLASSKTTDSITQSQGAASASASKQNSADTSAVPVAPPRRRKKGRKTSTSSSDQVNMNIGLSLPPTDKVIRDFLYLVGLWLGGGLLFEEAIAIAVNCG